MTYNGFVKTHKAFQTELKKPNFPMAEKMGLYKCNFRLIKLHEAEGKTKPIWTAMRGSEIQSSEINAIDRDYHRPNISPMRGSEIQSSEINAIDRDYHRPNISPVVLARSQNNPLYECSHYEWWVNLWTLWKCGWFCSIFDESGWICF